jgi:hypothetical protein
MISPRVGRSLLLVVGCLLPLTGCVEDNKLEPTGGTREVYMGPGDPPSPPPPPLEVPAVLAPYAPPEAPSGFAWVAVKGDATKVFSGNAGRSAWSVAFDSTSQPVAVYGYQTSTQGPRVVWILVKASDARFLPPHPYHASWKVVPVVVSPVVEGRRSWEPGAGREPFHPRASLEARRIAAHHPLDHAADHTPAASSHAALLHGPQASGAHAPAGPHCSIPSFGGHSVGGHAGSVSGARH